MFDFCVWSDYQSGFVSAGRALYLLAFVQVTLPLTLEILSIDPQSEGRIRDEVDFFSIRQGIPSGA